MIMVQKQHRRTFDAHAVDLYKRIYARGLSDYLDSWGILAIGRKGGADVITMAIME